MKTLKYYLDVDNGFLLAHEKASEFFVIYNQDTGEWADCNITFSSFKHDYYLKEISREEAAQKTNGRLPETKLREYLDLIDQNSGHQG